MSTRLTILWCIGLVTIFVGVTLQSGYAIGMITAGGLLYAEYLAAALFLMRRPGKGGGSG